VHRGSHPVLDGAGVFRFGAAAEGHHGAG
jgi:hypothetical protein